MPDGGDVRTEELSRDESIRLLQFESFVGRVGFVLDGKPVILPVNYLAENGSVVFCTTTGSTLSALAGGVDVAFEVDDSRPLYHSGWSVLVRGTAREVTDAAELERLRLGPLKSWAVRRHPQWIRITIDEISGRRLPET